MSVEDTLVEFQDELDRIDEESQSIGQRVDELERSMLSGIDTYEVRRNEQDLKSSKQEDVRRGIEALCSVLRLLDKQTCVDITKEAHLKLRSFIGALEP